MFNPPPGTDTVDITDSAVGAETYLATDNVLAVDPAVGAETPSLSDNEELTQTDSAVGTEASGIEDQTVQTDAAVGNEVAPIQDDLSATDTALGADAVAAIAEALEVQEPAVGSEAFIGSDAPLLIQDSAVGVEVVLINQAEPLFGQIRLDVTLLPHVTSIAVTEPSIVSSKPSSDGLPYRLWRGKRGREVSIKGRADTLADIAAIKAFNDGEPHYLTLPTGDSFRVLVVDVKPDSNVESPNQIPYSITVKAAVD